MSAFEQHGIRHLSYSAIDMFRTDPAAWLLRYPMRIRGGSNSNMWRGIAAEDGLEQYLTDEFGTMSVEDAVAAARKRFAKETALMASDNGRDKAMADLEGYVTNAIEAMKPFGRPAATQTRLSLRFDNCPVEIMGFDDFSYTDPNLSIDLKTTGRMPSQIMDNHKRQGALYQAMRPDYDIKFCYVTPKKFEIYDLDKDEAAELLEEYKVTVKKMETFLSLSNDATELASIFAPSYSSFYWNDPIMRSEAKRVFGV